MRGTHESRAVPSVTLGQRHFDHEWDVVTQARTNPGREVPDLYRRDVRYPCEFVNRDWPHRAHVIWPHLTARYSGQFQPFSRPTKS